MTRCGSPRPGYACSFDILYVSGDQFDGVDGRFTGYENNSINMSVILSAAFEEIESHHKTCSSGSSLCDSVSYRPHA